MSSRINTLSLGYSSSTCHAKELSDQYIPQVIQRIEKTTGYHLDSVHQLL